ncbi:hypothetical protein Tco_0206119 [Tanacetum coccineum]
MDESIWHRCTLDVQRMSRYASLYIRCSEDESTWYRRTLDVQRMSRYEERVRLLVGSPGASTTPIYSPGSSSTPIYSSGSSSTPIYSPGSSSTPIYSRNAECSNCKHLLDKITVLEATVDMYMHPEQHTVNSAALFHEKCYKEFSTCALPTNVEEKNPFACYRWLQDVKGPFSHADVPRGFSGHPLQFTWNI